MTKIRRCTCGRYQRCGGSKKEKRNGTCPKPRRFDRRRFGRLDQNVQAVSKEITPRTGAKRPISNRDLGQQVLNECEAIAAEILKTGKTVMDIANNLSAETEALAELLRKHGAAMGMRIEEFMTMSDCVRDKMRAAHGRLLLWHPCRIADKSP